jgi:prepilin-type N-terminal cleavage/methylation domain-containing protein
MRRAFTLIELLIVVAIIAILSAIAVPNFLEAQVRAKASRARSDLRTLATAIESYRVDQNAYPSGVVHGHLTWLRWLTTPIAYLTDRDLEDPFTPREYVDVNRLATFRYFGFNDQGVLNAETGVGRVVTPRSGDERLEVQWYALFCHAPDGVRNTLEVDGVRGTFTHNEILTRPERLIHYVYDPTNGTMSTGEMLRAGGAPLGATASAARLMETGR